MALSGAWAARVGVALALLVQGCGSEGPGLLRLSVELSDDSFCPGGVILGVARPETIEVRLGVRARGRASLDLVRQAVDVKVYRNDDHTKVVLRRRIHLSMTVGETWRQPLEPIRLVPPTDEGRYVLEVSTEDGAWSSTPLEVWFDAEACPRPGVSSPPATAPPASAPPPASVPPPSAPEPRRTSLQAGLRARWRCNAERGVEDLEVRVRVRNPDSAGRAERGFRPRVVGVDELDSLEQVAGELQEGYLPAGSTLEFEAYGWIETGPRPLEVHVSGERSAVATGVLLVDCSGGDGTRGEGMLGAWGR